MSQHRTFIRSRVYCAPSRVAGIGVHAGIDIKKGEHIFTLRGERYDFHGLIAAKGEELSANAYQIDRNLYIFPGDPESNYANHCCDPNAGLRGDVEMYALRDISEGEEILFDYSTTISERYWTMPCGCGAKNCRGKVGDFHDLPKDLQEYYISLNVVQRYILDEVQELKAGIARF